MTYHSSMMGDIERMTVAQYAEHEGITRQAVYKRVKAGTVVFTPKSRWLPLLIVTKYKKDETI